MRRLLPPWNVRLFVGLALMAVAAAGLVTGCQRQETPPAPSPDASTTGGDAQPTGVQPDAATTTPPAPDAEGWESLFDGKTLGKWESSDFWKPGKVIVKDGCIVLETGTGDLTGVNWAGDATMLPKVDYEISLEAQRVDGGDFFCGLTFPYKGSCASLVVGGWGGGVVGISSLDGFDASENETTNYKEFQNGKWYTVRLKITDKKMEAWIDGEQVVDAEVGERSVDVRIEVEASKPLGIAAYNTKAALRNIRMRRLLDE